MCFWCFSSGGNKEPDDASGLIQITAAFRPNGMREGIHRNSFIRDQGLAARTTRHQIATETETMSSVRDDVTQIAFTSRENVCEQQRTSSSGHKRFEWEIHVSPTVRHVLQRRHVQASVVFVRANHTENVKPLWHIQGPVFDFHVELFSSV